MNEPLGRKQATALLPRCADEMRRSANAGERSRAADLALGARRLALASKLRVQRSGSAAVRRQAGKLDRQQRTNEACN
jgi:hypothetical protein